MAEEKRKDKGNLEKCSEHHTGCPIGTTNKAYDCDGFGTMKELRSGDLILCENFMATGRVKATDKEYSERFKRKIEYTGQGDEWS